MTHKSDNYQGLLLLDKPSGISSHDGVDRIRRIISQRSIGHAGTLDPAAEGLLVLLLGKATKIARFLTEQDKEYEAEIRLGLVSTTYDAEGVDPDAAARTVPDLDEAALEELLAGFRGTITQKVPPYSAVHVDGERLYRRSRRGENVETPARPVRSSALDLLAYDRDRLRLRLSCSKGTYVRSLAHDIGERLGCGGHLSFLRRTRSGKFDVTDALDFAAVEQLHQEGRLGDALRSIDQALDFASVTVKEQFRTLVAHGQRPTASDIDGVEGEFQRGDSVLLKDKHGTVLAIGTAALASTRLDRDQRNDVLTYNRVFN